ncbi:uncharacterized protein LOC144656284 [Oculina patagonica]
MLWDVSWDQNNIVDGSRYSDHAFTLLKDTLIVRPTTRAPTQAAITSSGQETSQGTAQRNEKNREGRGHSHNLYIMSTTTELKETRLNYGYLTNILHISFDCADKQDGFYPNPSDCAKYYTCSSGTTYESTCPTGLLFNSISNNCDWSENVEC